MAKNPEVLCKQYASTEKVLRYLCFIDFIHSCLHRFKKNNFILEKSVTESIRPSGDQLITAFTILNCLEHEFLKGFLVQWQQQSLRDRKFSILSNILDLQ